MRDGARLLRAFLASPVRTGAIAPSSRFLAARMVEDMRLSEAGVVVELGPGTGAFTRAILPELNADALFLAIELNRSLAAHLQATQPPRVRVINDSCERLEQHLRAHERRTADAIISGLPWQAFSVELQERLLSAVHRSLRAGGRFATFAYLHGIPFPGGIRLRRMLRERFTKVSVSPVVWRNLPPAFVYRCEKDGDPTP
jgi:phospholipid N-methyltransferase